MTIDGVRSVARQEFMQRIRRGRWRWLLAAWFLVLLGVTVLMRQGLNSAGREVQPYRGAVMYGGLMLLVLSLALLVVPALAAQSVNGDRERGVLATLQVTRLSALEIALGKFVAAWGTTLVFLLLTAPLVLWCINEGGVDAESIAVVTVVMTVLLGTVCAVALALSALLSRSTTSGVLSYLVVFALTLGTLIVFGLATAVTQDRITVTTRQPVFAEGAWDQPPTADEPNGPEPIRFEDVEYVESRTRTDKVWWLLAPNPFVVLADSAPYRPRCHYAPSDFGYAAEYEHAIRNCDDAGMDPLGAMGRQVRNLRKPPLSAEFSGYNYGFDGERDAAWEERLRLAEERRDRDNRPVWPTGLALNLLLGTGSLVVATRRLRTPARTLARGQRVA
jgi:ABC-2 type transport system permease protein